MSEDIFGCYNWGLASIGQSLGILPNNPECIEQPEQQRTVQPQMLIVLSLRKLQLGIYG
jgi:hypothetical protein